MILRSSKGVRNKIKSSMILISVLFLVESCSTNKPINLKEGFWKAELERKDGNPIIFNLFVETKGTDRHIYVANATERMAVDSVVYRNDSIFLQMPFFDSRFEAKIINNETLSGIWKKDYGDRWEQMPFKAVWGDSSRYETNTNAAFNVTGSWDVFISNDRGGYKAIGLFNQEGNDITGTFFTPAGDYRYLQGVVSGDTLKISGFDGGHVMLFTALIKNGDKLTGGKLYSVNSPARDWEGVKKDYKKLPDAYAVSNIDPGTVKLNFTLKDMRTLKEVSLDDEQFRGKVIVIQMLGSWCPNCMDETPFMTDYYNKNHNRGVEILAIDFERTTDFEKSKQSLNAFFNHFDIPYPVLFSGVASSDPELTEKAFPGLPVKIHAFPTSIFIDKAGYVRKIHSGFNGPATGKYYDEFKEEFDNIMEGLLSE